MSYQYIPLGGGIQKNALANQRASVRYQCAPATSGRILSAEDHEFLRGWVLDLSIKGVGLLLPKPLKKGTFLVVQLKSSTKTYEIPANVAHATSHSNGEWLVGCEFVQPLTDDELDDLL